MNPFSNKKEFQIGIGLFLLGLVLSAINPHDYFTWFLEVVPALIGAIILLATRNNFSFTSFSYFFILIHCWILFIGGHYTYAEVPLFNTLKEVFHQSRNNYDKVGHFAQGFVPALITRELMIRLGLVNKRNWLAFLTLCVAVFISAMYEFLEWGVAILTGESAEAFLGTQGYVWDTQSDMLFATIGALCMLLFFSKLQDKAIQKLIFNSAR